MNPQGGDVTDLPYRIEDQDTGKQVGRFGRGVRSRGVSGHTPGDHSYPGRGTRVTTNPHHVKGRPDPHRPRVFCRGRGVPIVPRTDKTEKVPGTEISPRMHGVLISRNPDRTFRRTRVQTIERRRGGRTVGRRGGRKEVGRTRERRGKTREKRGTEKKEGRNYRKEIPRKRDGTETSRKRRDGSHGVN